MIAQAPILCCGHADAPACGCSGCGCYGATHAPAAAADPLVSPRFFPMFACDLCHAPARMLCRPGCAMTR